MDDYKKRIEAILFTTGRFMDVNEIAAFCGIASAGIVKQALEGLKHDYENKDSSLSILEENGKWKLNIRREYNYLTTKLVSSAEFDKPTQETLAIIAYKQPVFQAEIIKMRGNTAYDHVKTLRENGFITTEKSGRTRLIKLAPKFYDYFDIVEQELKAMINSVSKPDTPAVNEDSAGSAGSDHRGDDAKALNEMFKGENIKKVDENQ
jgi:segregation and condensation protein B